MTYAEFLQERFTLASDRLGLSDCARRALYALAMLDLDPSSMGQDSHNRQGVIGWDRMFSSMTEAGFGTDQIEDAVNELTDWRLAQVVGRDANDPVVSGPAAIRLTPEGRACIGLSPLRGTTGRSVPTGGDGWLVLHGTSRERLLSWAFEQVGEAAWRPILMTGAGVARVCGEVATSLCAHGCAIVDGLAVNDSDRETQVPELLRRTSRGSGLRVLMLPTPVAARVAGLQGPVRLRWIEPRASDLSADLDTEISVQLVRSDPGATLADVAGVPGSGIALPHRVDVDFADIIAPDSVILQLEQVKMHALFRLEVLPGRTSFKGRGGGYRLLLSGLPGTGKSMTAEALATNLGRSLVKLDLSAVLSKWLGETEQLIGKVFDMAEAAGSVLVLDEAESLFRQRQSGSSGTSALSTAVAYLLTRLERFKGVLVATTNRTQDVDEAFFRRFNDYVILPMPDVGARRKLWIMMLGAGEPQDLDRLGIDLDVLSERFTLSGGLIRGACIRASAWATGMNRPLSMPILLAALGRELEKSDRSAKTVFVRPWANEIKEILQTEG